MRVLTWNTAHRQRCWKEQLQVIRSAKAHIIALQEVTRNARAIARDGLGDIGYEHHFNTLDRREAGWRPASDRPYGVVIASRYPLRMFLPDGPRFRFPERFLSVVAKTDFGPVEIHAAHGLTGTGHGWDKIEMLEAIYERLARKVRRHRILCGDFNTPRRETPDGEIITFGQRVRENLPPRLRKIIRGKSGARWDAGERNILTGLKDFDLADVFREIHGYDVQEMSWTTWRKSKQFGGRFDHIFASAALNATNAEYLHEAREAGLSDHSPLVVECRPTASS